MMMILFGHKKIQRYAHKDDELFLQEAKEKGEMPPGIMYKSPLPPRAHPGKGSRSRSARGEKAGWANRWISFTDPGSAAPISLEKRALR